MPPRLYPEDGPARTQSKTAEPAVYAALAAQLSEEWVVVHSLPWLNIQVGRTRRAFAPTGETDFVLLHPRLGVLVLEIKGGTWQYNGKRQLFELLRWRQGAWAVDAERDVLAQAQANAQAVQEALRATRILPHQRVGYALVFPECSVEGRTLPPALEDPTTGTRLLLDAGDMAQLGAAVARVARYWREAFRYDGRRGVQDSEIGEDKIAAVLAALCPVEGYQKRLVRQIGEDRQWLELRPEQARVLERLEREPRAILVGGAGTGKTLIALEVARRAAEAGERVLILTFNRHLADRLNEARPRKNVWAETITTWSAKVAKGLGYRVPPIGKDDDQRDALLTRALRERAEAESVLGVNRLILDEAQSFHPEQIEALAHLFRDKPILACHDESQIFWMEAAQGRACVLETLQGALGVADPYRLTLNMRSPHAVFERLAATDPSPLQQGSLRPADPSQLQELIWEAEQFTVPAVEGLVAALLAEGVAPQEIVVLASRALVEDPAWQPLTRKVGQFTTPQRFRGCEAPVVIVLWDQAGLDSPALLCAYTRATTRAIVVYEATTLVGGAATRLGQALLNAPVAPEIKATLRLVSRAQAQEVIGHTCELLLDDAQPLDIRSAWIAWSPLLGGWLVDRAYCPDQPGADAWLQTLVTETPHPAFLLRSGYVYGGPPLTLDRYPPLARLDEERAVERAVTAACPQCTQPALAFEGYTEPPLCLDCTPVWHPMPDGYLPTLEEADRLLAEDTPTTRLPLCLWALSLWRACPYSPGLPPSYVRSGSPFRQAARLWASARGLSLARGQRVTLARLRQELAAAHPALGQVDPHALKTYAAVALNGLTVPAWEPWLGRPRPGTCERVEDPPPTESRYQAALRQMGEENGEVSRPWIEWARYFADLGEPFVLEESEHIGPQLWLPRLDLLLALVLPQYRTPDFLELLRAESEEPVLCVHDAPHARQPIMHLARDGRVTEGWHWTIQGGVLALTSARAPYPLRLQRAAEGARLPDP